MAEDSGLRKLELNDNGSKRVAIPSDVKNTLPYTVDGKGKKRLEPLRVTISPSGDYICLFEPAKFEKWADAFLNSLFEGGFESSNTKHAYTQSVLYNEAPLVTPDGNGRVNIPANMCEAAGFGSEVKQPFVVGDHIQIWAPDRWEKVHNEIDIPSLVANRSK